MSDMIQTGSVGNQVLAVSLSLVCTTSTLPSLESALGNASCWCADVFSGGAIDAIEARYWVGARADFGVAVVVGGG